MRKIIYAFAGSFLAVVFANSGFAQQAAAQKDYALIAKTSKDAAEVYKGYPEYQVAPLMEWYQQIESRVELKQVPYSDSEKYPLLTSVILKNKYNPDLVRDFGANFNAVTFNPLKYMFALYSKEELVYRVDNTSFIVIIYPIAK